jgi:hypothetical protein
MAITQVVVQTPANQTIFTDSAMGGSVDAVKATSALAFYLFADNSANGVPAYVKLFNVAQGSVTLGTTAPDEIVYVPANQKITHIFFTGAVIGKTFGTALSAAAVTTGGTAGITGSAIPVIIAYV